MAHLLHGHVSMEFPYLLDQGMRGAFDQKGNSLRPPAQGEDKQKMMLNNISGYLVSGSRLSVHAEEVRGTVAGLLDETLTKEAKSEGHNMDLDTLDNRLDDLINSYENVSESKDLACRFSSSSIGSTTWNSEMQQNVEVTSPAPSSNSTLTSNIDGASSMKCSSSHTSSFFGNGLSSSQGYLPNEHHPVVASVPIHSYGAMQLPLDVPGLSNPRSTCWISSPNNGDWSSSDVSIVSPETYVDHERGHVLQNAGHDLQSGMPQMPSSYQNPNSLHNGRLDFGTNSVQGTNKPAVQETYLSSHLHANMHLRLDHTVHASGQLNIAASSINSWDNYRNMNSPCIRRLPMNYSRMSHQLNLQSAQLAPQETENWPRLLSGDSNENAFTEKHVLQCRWPKKDLEPPWHGPHQPHEQFDQHYHWQKEHDLQQHQIMVENRSLGLTQQERTLDVPIHMKADSISDQISWQPQPALKKSTRDQCSAPNKAAVSSISANSGSEVRYGIVHQILLLYHHVMGCSDPERKCSNACIAMKKRLNHMSCCNDIHCANGCSQYKRLFVHHRNCHNSACGVCGPVRARVKSASLQAGSAVITESKRAASTLDTVDYHQSFPKRMKTVVSSLSHSCQSEISQISEPVTGQNHLPPQAFLHAGHEEEALPNARSGDIKPETNLSACSSQESSMKYCETKFEEPEVAAKLQLGVVHGTPEEIVTQCEQENMQIQKEINVIELDVKCKSAASSGKPKTRGVSLVDSFTPDQVREHLLSLRKSTAQNKAKGEKYQGTEQVADEYSCNLCGMENLLFEPPPRYCASCSKQISPKGMYFSTENTETTSDENDTQKFVCNKCYNIPGENIRVSGGEILKACLERRWNYAETNAETESWVQCDKCEAWQHQICALFNAKRNEVEQVEYTCPSCFLHEIENGEQKTLPQSKILGAWDLPTTMLSNHIEQWLFRRIKEERQERANALGKNFDEVPTAEGLVVRVVSSINKKVEVREAFKEVFQEENYPLEFPYISKAILLFQKIEGADVCLFGMYVQEFRSECASPNQRHICLSYIDSVKYFTPDIKAVTGEALRTFVYHEILIGYLDYCKKRGFVSCYIWACPPLKRDDYILYCHPEMQKMPKSDKLREWYQTLIRKAGKEKIVVDHTNLYDQFFVPANECKVKVTATRLPYFDSDYWPGEAENLLQNDGNAPRRKVKKAVVERALRAARRDASVGNPKDILLMHQLGEIIRPMKEAFIMIHLRHACKHCCQPIVSGQLWACNVCKNFQLCEKCYDIEKNLDNKDRHPIHLKEKHLFSMVEVEEVPMDTNDEEETILSEFFDTRLVFLSVCQANKYQFDTLRRAKYSTMMILYHLHNPTVPAFMSSCIVCHNDIELAQGWHCMTCPDYEVCDSCYQRKGGILHNHELVTRISKADPDLLQSTKTRKMQALKSVLDALVHASDCSARCCPQSFCQKIKRLFHHGSKCHIRSHGGCQHCKKMWHILHLHARACKQSECRVPRCRDLKDHMRKMQLQSDSRRRAGVKGRIRQQEVIVSGDGN